MIIYCDGAERPTSNNNTVAYGVVVHHDNQTHELKGRYVLSRAYCGLQEVIAFSEAMLFAESHGVDLSTISVYTDDQFVSYAHFFLHPENYKSKDTQALFGKLKLLNNLYSNDNFSEKFVGWISQVRINWVKGHKECVDNNRVDYLAKSALNEKEPKDRDSWLKFGFLKFDENGNSYKLYPAFVSQ